MATRYIVTLGTHRSKAAWLVSDTTDGHAVVYASPAEAVARTICTRLNAIATGRREGR